MIILSTPFEEFRKELLTKPKGFEIKTVLERGLEHEAIQASQDSLKCMSIASGTSNNIDSINKSNVCRKWGLRHKPPSLANQILCSWTYHGLCVVILIGFVRIGQTYSRHRIWTDSTFASVPAYCICGSVKAVQSPSSSDIQVTPPEGAKIRSIEQLKQWFPACFDGIGCFKGEEELHLKPDAKPYIDAPHQCPIHLRDKIKSQLDKMEELGIIRKIDTHID